MFKFSEDLPDLGDRKRGSVVVVGTPETEVVVVAGGCNLKWRKDITISLPSLSVLMARLLPDMDKRFPGGEGELPRPLPALLQLESVDHSKSDLSDTVSVPLRLMSSSALPC